LPGDAAQVKDAAGLRYCVRLNSAEWTRFRLQVTKPSQARPRSTIAHTRKTADRARSPSKQ